ncbi:MAG TPA: prepilin-type N-terminal cleavage/methylation domain-containing protein [Ruminiclostridium sp.]
MDIKNKKGLTLVEVVVTVAILAIIMIPISLVFTTAYASFIGESDKVTAQQSAREILYGKGINSYGIMGYLERSDATSSSIIIGTELNDVNATGHSISIKDYNVTSTGQTKIYYYEQEAIPNIWKLKYKIIASDGLTVLSDVDYFINDKSSNGKTVEVKDFVVEKVKRTDGTAPATATDKDTDLIKITVTVACGRSGNITLQSSYRFPNIER